jgi:ATP-dependent RNA helicase DeaD
MHPVRVPSHDDILQAFRKAGLPSLTPFQAKLIPVMLKGRDIVAEIAPGEGSATGVVAALALSLRGANPVTRAVILTPGPAEIAKVGRAFARFTRAMRDVPSFMPLGEIEDERREQRRLEKGATVVAGTVERVIDHIRRGSLPIGELRTIIMLEPAAAVMPEFIKDVQFIYTRLPERPQTILLSRSALPEDNELVKLLRHPATLGEKEAVAVAGHFAFVMDGGVKTEALSRIVLGMRLPPIVVLHSARADQLRIAEALQQRGLRVMPFAGGQGMGQGGRQLNDRRNAVLSFARGSVDVLLVTLGQGSLPAELEDVAPAHVVFLDLPVGQVRIGAAGLFKAAQVMVLVDRGQEKDLTRLQEAIGVAFTTRDIPSDDEVLTGTIDRILLRMKGEDQAELSRLRARIRRQVPLLQRPFFMASLLKAQLSPGTASPAARQRPAGQQPAAPQTPAVPPRGQRGRFGRNTPTAPGARPVRSADAVKQPREAPRPTGDYAQLFVSVGRNRRVYARDLTDLFMEKLQLTAGDLGGVRVFEKYSFVDIVSSKAQDAITRLSGTEVKGRPITVNFAKKKEEKEER